MVVRSMAFFSNFLAILAIVLLAGALTEQAGVLQYQAPDLKGDENNGGSSDAPESQCLSHDTAQTHLTAVYKCSKTFKIPIDHLVGTFNMWALRHPILINATHPHKPHPGHGGGTDHHAKLEEFEATYRQLMSKFKENSSPDNPSPHQVEALMCFGSCVNKQIGMLHENGSANHDFIKKRLNEITNDKIPEEMAHKIIQACHSLSEFKPEDVVTDNPMDPNFNPAMCPAVAKFTMCISRTIGVICRMMMMMDETKESSSA